jgi:arylsulfatase A-like enzyme
MIRYPKLLLFFLYFFFALLITGIKVSNASNLQQPNVILIMADDLGYGDVGFNGHDIIRTPHLDDMASKGVVLDRFYAASPLCSPTRGSCLTGRHPFRYGVLAAHTGGMRDGEITVAEIFKENGYATGFFGKWHLGWVKPDEQWDNRGMYSPPRYHGFDKTFATKSAVPTWNPTITPDGWNSWGQKEGEPWKDGTAYVENGEVVTENLQGDDSRIIMDRAIPFIEDAAARKKPFFTCIWFHTPHEPVVAGPEHKAMYSDHSEKKQHFFGCITAMDEQIGRLRKKLRELGIEENTIVWFTSDNGPAGHLVEAGVASAGKFRGSKHTVYEGGLRVPTVLEWPTKTTQFRSDFMCGTVDLLPTVVSMADIDYEMDDRPIDGINIESVIFNNGEIRRDDMGFGWIRLYRDIKALAWTDNQYKLILRPLQNEVELYDLLADPSETNNLADDMPERVKKMRQELAEWEKSCQLSRDGNDYEF